MYAHVLLNIQGYPYNPKDKNYNSFKAMYLNHPLVVYKKLPKKSKKKKLIQWGDNEIRENENTQKNDENNNNNDNKDNIENKNQDLNINHECYDNSDSCNDNNNSLDINEDPPIVGFWKPVLTIRPLCDWTRYKAGIYSLCFFLFLKHASHIHTPNNKPYKKKNK